MRVTEAFPSKYLGASDLDGRPAVVRIDQVFMDRIDNENKMIIAFVGKRKTMVCNKTNATKIAEILGDDETDRWTDQMIELYTAEVDYQGRSVEAIRVRAPRARTEATAPQRQAAPPPREPVYADDPPPPRRAAAGNDPGEYTQASPPPRRAAPARNADMDDDIPF